jgi:Spy/CpxP family protein refolding chaperone
MKQRRPRAGNMPLDTRKELHMKRIVAVIASIVLLTAAAGAQLRRGPGPMGGPLGGPMGGPGGPGGNPALAEYLSLTTEQKAAWETIQSDLRASGRALHEQEHTLADQVEAATEATAIGNLVLQMRAIGTQLEAAHDAADAKFAALLTADQKTKFAAFQAASEFLHRRGPAGPPR